MSPLNSDSILTETDFSLVSNFNNWFNNNEEIIKQEFSHIPLEVAAQFTLKEFGLELFTEIN